MSIGALSCYLYKYGMVSQNRAEKMVFEQGYSMKKPSDILASLSIRKNEIYRVKIGGTAVNTGEIIVDTK